VGAADCPAFVITPTNSSLQYEQDFNLWIDQTVALLKEGHFKELDLENLIDELESISKRDRREVLSRLKIMLMHLLKRKYQPDQRSGSWESSIRNNRDEIAQILMDSPSLKSYPQDVLEQAYAIARKNAASEADLSPTIFLKFTLFQLMKF
jgi:Domain of unknown function DUF29